MFSCEFCKIFKNTFYTEHLPATTPFFLFTWLDSYSQFVNFERKFNNKTFKCGKVVLYFVDKYQGMHYIFMFNTLDKFAKVAKHHTSFNKK